MEKTKPNVPTFEALLIEAVTKPGKILEAYSAFHSYSVGNQLLALWQCAQRGITPGPLATYPGWQAKGRQVRKGERALALCMPVTCKARGEQQQQAQGEQQQAQGDAGACFTRFIYRSNWFVVSQTDGADLPALQLPEFDLERALATLGISRIEFDLTDGNPQGYARAQSIAISPLAQLPHKTTFHEIAHVVLGHTAEKQMTDGEHTPRNLCEVEAEAVALLCCETLGLAGADYSRGYIQHWLGASTIPEKSAQRIFKAADSILKAGRAAAEQQAAA